MRFEKRMLILSGEGKGIVMIERSGAGVKFSLKTFEFGGRPDLKAGIVTPSKVMIRDLPSTRDPAAVFYTDDLELDKLHFALFDREILLYGACGERMWESNLIDILARHDKSKPALPPTPISRAEYTALPQSPAARSLPSPSVPASGYGDEYLASQDFYTPFDFSERMNEVDAFLDTPRVLTEPSILDGLSPRIIPHAAQSVPAETEVAAEVEAETENDAAAASDESVSAMTDADGALDAENSENNETSVENNEKIEKIEESDGNATAEPTETEASAEAAAQSETETEKEGNFVITDNVDGEFVADMTANEQANADVASGDAVSEAAASAETVEAEKASEPEQKRMPWEMESKWLSSRGGRRVVKSTPKVAKINKQTDVQRLRDSLFIERCRADIDKLFGAAPKDEELGKLLPDIDWIRAELGSGVISVGRGGDSFLCYAVGGTYSRENPFGDDAQWLPSRRAEPSGQGYWLIFQSLKTGEIIKN